MEQINARKVAVNILQEMDEHSGYSNIMINKKITSLKIPYLERKFISQLVYGVIENKMLLDHLIESYSTTKLSKMNPLVLNAIRIGAYQILFLDKIPSSAAVNESVKIVKKKHPGFSGFTNGVLRNIARSPEDMKLPDKSKDLAHYYAIKYSHPQWLVDRWLSRYEEAFVENLLVINNKPAEITVRANLIKTYPEELSRKLVSEGFITEPSLISKSCLKMKQMNKSIIDSQLFKDGFFIVQDEASSLVAEIVSPRKGEKVLDVCAAPGGKSLYMAELMENQGELIARDIYPHKLQLILENAKRLGIDIIKTHLLDATVFDENSLEKFDKVLVDAPCSGLGIIRRKPEIRYNRKEQDIIDLSQLQYKILENAARYLKPNGELVYSTCTIEPEENENIIMKFMEAHKDGFTLVDLNKYIPEKIRTENPYINIYPTEFGTDGFFICKIRKN